MILETHVKEKKLRKEWLVKENIIFFLDSRCTFSQTVSKIGTWIAIHLLLTEIY